MSRFHSRIRRFASVLRSVVYPHAHLPGSNLRRLSREGDEPLHRRTLCIVSCALILAACGSVEQRPPPEARIEFRNVPVPTPVPCFREEDRPIAPDPTPIDLDNATTDQMAAAVAADNIAEDRYMRQLEALFVQCMKSQGKEIR